MYIPKCALKQQKLQILADDTADILHLLKSSLETTTSWQIRTVVSSHEGLLVAQSNPPDLILSDVRMPLMDGLELAHQLRSSLLTQHIPLLLMTSTPQLVSRQQRQELKILKVIAKPFDPLTIADSIASILV